MMWSQNVYSMILLVVVSNHAKLFNKGSIAKGLESSTIKEDFTSDSKKSWPEDINLSTVYEIKRNDKPNGWLSKKKCEEYTKLRDELYGEIDNCQSSATMRIVGGQIASHGEFPHMASWDLMNQFPNYRCGASLISDQYLLTAGHCNKLSPYGPFVAILGTTDIRTQIFLNISERIFHPDYNKTQLYSDISLLRLSEPVNFTRYIWPACLQTSNFIQQKEAIATGWGSTETIFSNYSDHLLKVALPLKNISECIEAYPPNDERGLYRGVDEDSMICVGGKYLGKNPCRGDSGGPLQVLKKTFSCIYDVLGVTSFGNQYCGSDVAVYTKVSSFIPWIESIVWPDEVQ